MFKKGKEVATGVKKTGSKGTVNPVKDATINVGSASGRGIAGRRLAKAELIKAKALKSAADKLPRTVGALARGAAASVASSGTARAAAQTANSAAAAAALAQWNAVNNRKSTPAEGTGTAAEDGSNTTGTTNPSVTGNSPREAYRGY